MPFHAYDSQKAAQARNRHHDESFEQTGRKKGRKRIGIDLTAVSGLLSGE
jgi:hypothetical protein